MSDVLWICRTPNPQQIQWSFGFTTKNVENRQTLGLYSVYGMLWSLMTFITDFPRSVPVNEFFLNVSIFSRDKDKSVVPCFMSDCEAERTSYRERRDHDLAERWVLRGQCLVRAADPRRTDARWLDQWRTDRTAVSTDQWGRAAASRFHRHWSCTASADDSTAAATATAVSQPINQSINQSVIQSVSQSASYSVINTTYTNSETKPN